MLRLASFLGLSIVLVVAFACAFHPLYAVDFFWHLALGEVIARTGSIPDTNTFSAALPDRPYVQFNWLWELGAAALVEHFGLRGVRVTQAAMMAGSIGALYALARNVARRAEPALCIAALGLVWFEDRFQERPASLVLAFVVALAALWFSSRRSVWLAALLAVIWSNLHGGESMLVVLTWLALCAGELANRRSLRQGSLLLAVSCAALCLSPTFLPGLATWSSTIGAQVQAGNEEWQPAWSMLEQGLRPSFVLIALGPTAVALAWAFETWRRYRQDGRAALDWSEIFLCCGYLALAHHAVRNVFLSVVPLLFLLARAPEWTVRARSGCVAASLVLVGIAAEDALLFSYGGVEEVAELADYDVAPDAFPELATAFAREAELEGGVVNDGRWGGYLIWQLWPRCSVFADSRHHLTPEMWQVFRSTHDALQRPQGLEYAFRHYGTELTMFRGPTFPLGIPPNYRLLYKAGDQELYQDLRGAHAAENLARTRRWLAEQEIAVPDDPRAAAIPELARTLGARRFLHSRYQQWQAARAREDLGHPSASVRGRAHQRLALLDYRAGNYGAAAGAFERAVRELPNDLALRYQAAQNAFAAGDFATAAELMHALLQTGGELAPRQVRRLEAMLAVTRAR